MPASSDGRSSAPTRSEREFVRHQADVRVANIMRFNGATYAEIASHLHVTVKTARSYCRALP